MRKINVPRIEDAEPITTIVETTKSTFDVPFIPWHATSGHRRDSYRLDS